MLLDHAVSELKRWGTETRSIDLASLPADGLLGRRFDPSVQEALGAVTAADIVVVATPVYRASYTGLLKVFCDLLPPNALAGKVAISIATGGVAGHLLVLEHGLAPLLASLGALLLPTGIYGIDGQFQDNIPDPTLLARVERASREAIALATSLSYSEHRIGSVA